MLANCVCMICNRHMSCICVFREQLAPCSFTVNTRLFVGPIGVIITRKAYVVGRVELRSVKVVLYYLF